ncbi:helix-turn-helix transcriptional regulator [Pseudomonas sp. S75]|uniref:winged helix-turn-helix transcriptional regulator n=1 Tax=unclassified Pseudomonas TaxID=196821 RepID=UPI0019083535|nr:MULTISPECIES: helix-turn-helix domain-containing protein [unclassified Pseudomonas]MBJ9977529.1 helix-turn-helix transcriptional regulator [Pseudomonas sp. S30]MBK0155192.1 helix-turn-helix transcriptional regulator [Pseudomonas sp. S75]
MAKHELMARSECPVARTLEAIGDRWILMILREAFDGVSRFSDFQRRLGVARNILTVKLKALVELGIFEVQPASDGSAYKEYVLTEMGQATFPIVISLRQWGERFLYRPGEMHSVLLDNASAQPVQALTVRARDGKALGPQDCHRSLIRRED